MVRKFGLFLFSTLLMEVGLMLTINFPAALSYTPMIIIFSGILGFGFDRYLLSKIDIYWGNKTCIGKNVFVTIIILVLTLVFAGMAIWTEPIIWHRFFADKAQHISPFWQHLIISGLIAVMCVAVCAYDIHRKKNKEPHGYKRKVLSWLIGYLRNETTIGREKSDEFLIELVTIEVRKGRLHLWVRSQNKDAFISPKEFNKKHYIFELRKDQYHIRSLVDASVLWGSTFIESEICRIWPPKPDEEA